MEEVYVLYSPVSPSSVYDTEDEAIEFMNGEIEYRLENVPKDMESIKGSIGTSEYKIVKVKVES